MGRDPIVAQLQPRTFYLTQTTHNGSQVLTACASGYHMASLWEILDPSNLRYDTQLGFTRDDSGSGPPTIADGWIRTGNAANAGNIPGFGNCQTWTSDNIMDEGELLLHLLASGVSPAMQAESAHGARKRSLAPNPYASGACRTDLRLPLADLLASLVPFPNYGDAFTLKGQLESLPNASCKATATGASLKPVAGAFRLVPWLHNPTRRLARRN